MTAVVSAKDSVVAALDKAVRMLAEVVDAASAKHVADMARAAEVYARRQNLSKETISFAHAINIDATRLLGEFLRKTEKASGGERGGRKRIDGSRQEPSNRQPTYAELGLNKKVAFRAQKLATIAEAGNGIFDDIRSGNKTIAQADRELKRRQREVELQDQAKQLTGTVDDLGKLIANGYKFGTIYADPPWQYSNQSTRAATYHHYPTMTVEEIVALPIKKLAADESHLHLWTTNAFLFECPRIMKAWGFEYKGVFVWVKPQMGIGNYWRVSHELMLLGVRGGLTFSAKSHMSWLKDDRTKHSAKPPAIRKIVECVSPKPRLELFARTPADDWISWPDCDVVKGIFDQDIKAIG